MNIDLVAALRAAAVHFEHHPQLVADAIDVSVAAGKLRAQAYRYKAHLGALAEWVPTLGEAQPVLVHISDRETVHLWLRGQLADGMPVEVVCLPDQFEVDLLAANVRLEEGDTFPVELLLRLTSAPAAETRPAADTRTCESPGDQEHDHAMCEDAVTDETATAVTR